MLVSAKAEREAQRRQSWGSCLGGNESITEPAEPTAMGLLLSSLHLAASSVPVS